MKKTLAKILCLVFAVVMVVGCFTSCGKTNYAENNTKIKIGVSGPLTGGAAIYGIAVRNAAQLAVDEINKIEADGKGPLGLQFDFVMYDDKHDATNVPTGYANLYENGMQVSLGTVTTKPGLEFKVLSADDNVFFLTPSATGDDIPKDVPNGYQMCFADSNQGEASAKYFNENYQGKKIGVFYKADDEYSTGIFDKFKLALNDGLKAGMKEASFTGEATTFDSQIQALKDCDVIFMPIYYTPASQFMTQGKTTVKASAIYYGCDGLDGIDAIEGFDIATIPQEISYLSHFNSNATEGPAKAFIDKYNAAYDEEKEPLNQFGAAAYDCVWAIYEAMKVAKANGKEIPANIAPSDLCDILTEVFNGNFTFRGITGKTEGNEKSTISWKDSGYVNKEAIKYVVKEANA